MIVLTQREAMWESVRSCHMAAVTKNGNYDISYQPGKLTVEQAEPNFISPIWKN